MPWGEEYTGATLVDMYLAELAAHAWDLARATGHRGKSQQPASSPSTPTAGCCSSVAATPVSGRSPWASRRSARP